MEPYQITLVVAFVLAAAELLTGAFVLLGLSVGALAVAATQWWTGALVINRDLLIFSLFALAAFVVFRKVFRKPQDQHASTEDVNRY